MKYAVHTYTTVTFLVAPFAGAWIEILAKGALRVGKESLPSRERGLKYALPVPLLDREKVAPFAGAWIEI